MSSYPATVVTDPRLNGTRYATREAAVVALDAALRAGHTTIVVTIAPPRTTLSGIECRAIATAHQETT